MKTLPKLLPPPPQAGLLPVTLANNPQNVSHWTHFVLGPLLLVHPRQVVGLSVIVAELSVRPVYHLLHLRQCDAVTLRAERHNALRLRPKNTHKNMFQGLLNTASHRHSLGWSAGAGSEAGAQRPERNRERGREREFIHPVNQQVEFKFIPTPSHPPVH